MYPKPLHFAKFLPSRSCYCFEHLRQATTATPRPWKHQGKNRGKRNKPASKQASFGITEQSLQAKKSPLNQNSSIPCNGNIRFQHSITFEPYKLLKPEITFEPIIKQFIWLHAANALWRLGNIPETKKKEYQKFTSPNASIGPDGMTNRDANLPK